MPASISTGYLDARPDRTPALIATVALHAIVITGLFLFKPQFERAFDPGMKIMPIPETLPQPKPQRPLPPKRPTGEDHPRPEPRPPVEGSQNTDTGGQTTVEWPPLPPLPPQPPIGDGIGTGDAPVPVLVGAADDPRFAGQLQPPYPSSLARLEIEGKVTVRVRVGTDGRVVEVQLVKADRPEFFTATRDWALRKWRFRPATRDGAPIEGWLTRTVSFVLTAEH